MQVRFFCLATEGGSALLGRCVLVKAVHEPDAGFAVDFLIKWVALQRLLAQLVAAHDRVQSFLAIKSFNGCPFEVLRL